MLPTLRKHISAIVSLSDEEFDVVSKHFTERKYRKHQYVIQEGQVSPNEYFVIKGCLKAYFLDEKGKEHILQFAVENWWISDFNAYFKRVQATTYVECMEDCVLLELTLDSREQLCSEMHKISDFFRLQLTSGYTALQKRIQLSLSKNTKERYEAFLRAYPTISQRIPKQLIASFLGVSRETLSRLEI
ncbi:Crp/Fnr family transcriptional regulator [Aquimarina sp. 2201CG5-10]|uniref:Crp/Fnr family transcriptional regulator n=1 Tax=Aquimarina callyspongiae TaxID=3098150 RepID=UPI002AB457DE|nr:Crp/Fnr family transcriptional regulator [Aquimarina sp. 2201CG5-10]MDY8135542.1 Crp/Fnr family transcriptional regulator [Aquimarina sp. 2201CG5-10]